MTSNYILHDLQFGWSTVYAAWFTHSIHRLRCPQHWIHWTGCAHTRMRGCRSRQFSEVPPNPTDPLSWPHLPGAAFRGGSASEPPRASRSPLLEICLQRVELIEKQALFQSDHPALAQQCRRVHALEQSLKTLVDQGRQVDEQHVDTVLTAQLQRATVELAVARQDLTDSHPRLALLELRLQSLSPVAAQRALAG